MRAFCDEGHALLAASTDLEEVIAIADVRLTVYRGQEVAVHECGAVDMHRLVADITHPAGASSTSFGSLRCLVFVTCLPLGLRPAGIAALLFGGVLLVIAVVEALMVLTGYSTQAQVLATGVIVLGVVLLLAKK